MPRQRKNERIAGQYFTWVLSCRDGIWWADGRSNKINVGRHSLREKDRADAVKNLYRLDLTVAIQHGLAEAAALQTLNGVELHLLEGRELYENHVKGTRVAGGARKSSQKRYRAVLDKLLIFLEQKRVTTWNGVTVNVLKAYLNHLKDNKYKPRTQYLEGITVKQVINFLISEGKLPAEAKIHLKLRKPTGTDTYCWHADEVKAMFEFTQVSEELRWLQSLIVTLCYTGLRIGEAITLRWKDINFATGMITLVDESSSGRRQDEQEIRTTKGGQGRSFPINDELRPVLEAIPKHADGFVFHGPLGGRLKADTVRNILIRDVLKPLGTKFPKVDGEIGFRDGRLHSFRHFFCSMCANKGVAQQVVMRWLGHKDSKLVTHYYHLYDDEARRQMQRISLKDFDSGGTRKVD